MEKSNKDIENNENLSFNDEIKGIINYAISEVIPELPSLEITPEMFLYSALECGDSVLLAKLLTYCTSFTIQNITNSLFSQIQNKSITAVKPGRQIALSKDTMFLMMESCGSDSNYDFSSYDFIRSLFKHKDETKYRETVNIFFNEKVTEETLAKIEQKEKASKERETLTNAAKETVTGIVKPQNDVSKIPYCTNMNTLHRTQKYDLLVGRKNEVAAIDRILLKKDNSNVLLVGESGVGKSAIINGLVGMCEDGYAPVGVRDKEFFLFNMSEMVGGTSLRGMFEERMNNFVRCLQKRNNIVLVIEDLHKLLTARREDDYDFPTMLSNILTTTNVKLICTTTQNGYSKYISARNDLSRKFQTVRVDAPNDRECLEILGAHEKKYGKFHGMSMNENAIRLVMNLAKRYITDKNLPSSAFDIMDEIGAMKKSDTYNSGTIGNTRKSIELMNLALRENVGDSKRTEEEIKAARLDMAKYVKEVRESNNVVEITEEDVYKAVALHTDIPIEKLNTSEKETVKNIDNILKTNIIGQDEAISTISRAIKRSKIGLSPKNRPLGTFLLLGESGVGKTLLAKMLAKEIFGNEKYLVKFDMSEYSDKTSVNKLIGASAGYIGYDKGGLLTEAVKEKKYCVLLLDEIEKAHIEVHNLCLQIFDEGCLTDNTGQKVDFRNTIVILTSNVGARKAAESNAIGFVTDEGLNKKGIIVKELKNKFPPEFLNRLDEIVYFNRLTDESLRKIIRLELKKFTERIGEIGFGFTYDDGTVDYLLRDVRKDEGSGARPIIRSIQNNIETVITDIILDNDWKEHCFECTCSNDGLNLNIV